MRMTLPLVYSSAEVVSVERKVGLAERFVSVGHHILHIERYSQYERIVGLTCVEHKRPLYAAKPKNAPKPGRCRHLVFFFFFSASWKNGSNICSAFSSGILAPSLHTLTEKLPSYLLKLTEICWLPYFKALLSRLLRILVIPSLSIQAMISFSNFLLSVLYVDG